MDPKPPAPAPEPKRRLRTMMANRGGMPERRERATKGFRRLLEAGQAKGVAVVREPRVAEGGFEFGYFIEAHGKPLAGQV